MFSKVSALVVGVAVAVTLAGCSTPPANTSPDQNPSASETPYTPDVLVGIPAAIQAALKTDVSSTKNNISVFLLTNPTATTIPAEQIVNTNPGRYDITVTFNDDGTYTVTGTAKTSDFVYSESGTYR